MPSHRMAQVQIENGPQLTCHVAPELAIHPGDQCIMDVDGFLEFGRTLSVAAAGDVARTENRPEILRCATLQDQAEAKEVALRSKFAREKCVASAEHHKLDMRIVQVRYSFDRKLLRVVFAATDRVDFRAMVGDLAREFGCRVEMKQIGVRDEAAMIGGLGPCGRELCCCTWLRHFQPVNVRMAKVQNFSLNPGAISGMCGRLKCCLRYEHEQYRDLSTHLPREGACVECPHGEGWVVDRDILGQRVKVRLGEERVIDCAADDVMVVRREQQRRPYDDNPAAERPQSRPARDTRARDLRSRDAG